tara:strand:+ start:394 stop:507 length:114 start_codon:yes stop_codon:yes gene_type:complete
MARQLVSKKTEEDPAAKYAPDPAFERFADIALEDSRQ